MDGADAIGAGTSAACVQCALDLGASPLLAVLVGVVAAVLVRVVPLLVTRRKPDAP